MLKKISLIMLLTICLSAWVSAEEFRVDGNPEEWAGTAPVYEDGQDLSSDSEMLGFDMDTVFTVVENDRRYVAIRLLDDWPYTSGAGAISWKIIVDMDGDDQEDFRIQNFDVWNLYLPEGDDVYAHRHTVTGVERTRVGTTIEFSFPPTFEPLSTRYPDFRFTNTDYRWRFITNQQQSGLDGTEFFSPGS